MYSIGISPNKIYSTQQAVTSPVTSNVIPPVPSASSKPVQNTSFKGESTQLTNIRTQLTTNDEKTKYSQLYTVLDKSERQDLDLLLKSGILLSTDSNDKTSTLDSLYKMVSTPRLEGINPKVALSDTISTIANPFKITQNFGDIPKPYIKQILDNAQPNPRSKDDVINPQTIDVKNSSACVSASIEFNLAKQMPAEFARFAQELSSPKMSVDKTIELKNLSTNTLDAIWLLDAFKVPYNMGDFNKAKLTLAPDKNAIIRAQIQNNNKDYMERSVIDTLMQSTFMNVGSQQTYDTLTDIRGGAFNADDKGLIEFEKTFTESVVEDKNKTSVTYQILDDNAKLVGYETDFNTMKKHILDSLSIGENVIIGYTQFDKDKKVINGHEITIIGAVKDKTGNLIFICNDTDDDNPNPIAYPADKLIPQIHHAGLPQQVVDNDIKFVDSWVDGINAYKEAKKQANNTTQSTKLV